MTIPCTLDLDRMVGRVMNLQVTLYSLRFVKSTILAFEKKNSQRVQL
jgi:hypothetical protein